MPTAEELLQINLQEDSEEYHPTTKIKWGEKEYPLMQKHTVNTLAERVLYGLEANQYQNLLVCGKSGTGKTTFVQNLLHNMVCKRMDKKNEQPFQIQWHSRDDIQNLDKIVTDIQQGTPTILVMDDASYELDELPTIRRRQIFKTMTTIRHHVKSKILVIFITHYSRSMQKYLRSDADFTVLMSLSTSEMDNWIDIWGKNATWKLKTFQKQYTHSMRQGSFIINRYDSDKPYIYGTNKPFRIALTNELGVDIHPTLFVDQSCNFCRFQKQSKERIEAKALFDQLMFSYKNKANDVIQWFAYFHGGIKTALPDDKRRALNFLLKLLAKYDVDMEKLLQIAENSKKYGKKKSTHYTRQYKKMTAEILKESNLTPEQTQAAVGFGQLFN